MPDTSTHTANCCRDLAHTMQVKTCKNCGSPGANCQLCSQCSKSLRQCPHCRVK